MATMSAAAAAAAMAALADQVRATGLAAGLGAVGMAEATPFAGTRAELERRKVAGLHGGMQFTYRNPQRSTDAAATLPGVRTLVVAARGYRRQPVPTGPAPAGRVARYAWEDHYAALRCGLDAVAAVLAEEAWEARVVLDDNALHDREAAYRAGLGWYGKNSNLLLPEQGSWFVLGSVLTDAPLPTARAPEPDGCGPCRRCLDGCPTGAIVAPGVVDARRCLAWLVQAEGPFPREFRVALDDRIYGCDDCQEVCPPNRRAAQRPAPDAGPGAEPTVDLLGLLAATDTELLARHGRWYVPRRDARYLRRNALVALGNAARESDEAVLATLRRYLADPDPLLRAHATWAARRLGRDDLLDAVAEDRSDDVRTELAAPAPPVRPR
ncbi:tRNA epoxyqueuosine(34) reductase QueG [soil metagenome]